MNLTFSAVLLLAMSLAPAAQALAESPAARTLYTRALERERAVRDAARQPTLLQLRVLVRSYEVIVEKYPRSGYSDNALWQAGQLALLAFERFGHDVDRRTALRLLKQLKGQYPTSTMAARADATLREPRLPPVSSDGRAGIRDTQGAPATAVRAADNATLTAGTSGSSGSPVLIRDIRRSTLPEGTRVTIEMDGEASFHAERLHSPRRVFFDLKGTRTIPELQDATLKFSDAVVREVRLGRHPQNITRIVFDMDGAEAYSVFTLYNPFRLVIDFKSAVPAGPVPPDPLAYPASSYGVAVSDTPAVPLVASLPPSPQRRNTDVTRGGAPLGAAPTSAVAPGHVSPTPIPPAVPTANTGGTFSLARQLGLGVARIVIDPGHGGHDPGALGDGITEAEIVLDVALRLKRLLQKQSSVEVVLTRETNVFVPLEERTAIANREGADLFLSIHANASGNSKARGVETYFLNFATDREAEAVAARENSASGRAMHSLPDILRVIALNNKIDESRDFAEMVQRSMVRTLSPRNKELKDLGVKQAPFVVLIGAAMPSVLAEISFVTHRQEGLLLKTGAYRQQIAEALLDAVVRYQQSLKKIRSIPLGIGAR